jgi:hypothetical protein
MAAEGKKKLFRFGDSGCVMKGVYKTAPYFLSSSAEKAKAEFIKWLIKSMADMYKEQLRLALVAEYPHWLDEYDDAFPIVAIEVEFIEES